MRASRNPQGNPDTLVKAAQAKKEDATERLEKAIKKVVDSGEIITFRAVAETAGLSVSYLYKYPEIKNKIAHLRSQQQVEVGGIVNNAPQIQPASDKSKAVLLSKLREENRGLRAENEGLRKHIEAVQGRVVELRHVEAENTRLKQRVEELSRALQEAKVTPINSKQLTKSTIGDQIKDELKRLGIKLNSTLSQKIKASTDEVVLAAIEALKDQRSRCEIQNPGGWLASAIEEGWVKSESLQQQEKSSYDKDGFEEWYAKAIASGEVIDIPVAHLNLDSFHEPKVKINKPGLFGAPYTELPWREASYEIP